MTTVRAALIAQGIRRQNDAADPLASAWVRANAGTGKTKILTDRVINLLLAGSAPEKILCLTFTRAAAAEMANRLTHRLARWAVMKDAELDAELGHLGKQQPTPDLRTAARRLFARLLDAPGRLNVQTIHGFCQSLLRRFPLEASICPHFSVLEDLEARILMREARDQILVAAETGINPELTDALRTVAENIDENSFAALMAALTEARAKLTPTLGDGAARDTLRRRLGLDPGETVSTLMQDARQGANQPNIKRLAHALERGSAGDVKAAHQIHDFLSAPEPSVPTLWDDYSRVYLTDKGEPRSARRFPSKAAREADPDVTAIVEAETERVLRTREQLCACRTFEASNALLTVAKVLMTAYETRKKRVGKLDYDDLILISRRLLSDSAAAQWALYKLDGGVEHVLIDEAQDTSPEQWAVVRALVDDFFAGASRFDMTRTLFAVGDRKQSIFSFQGADPDEFDAARRLFCQRVLDAKERFKDLALSVSFRSTSAILQAVDAVFADNDARDGVSEDATIHHAFRDGHAGLVELWPPLTTPPSADETPGWAPPLERVAATDVQTRMAAILAQRIARMIDSGEQLESRGRPIRAGDILVLVRKRGSFVEELTRELKRSGVAVAGADRMILAEQLAVMDLIALGESLLLPEDDLTLATALKGPILGLSEDDLFTIAHGRPTTLWAALRAAAEQPGPARTALRTLRELMAKADFLPPYEMYSHILGPLGGRKKLLARLGPSADDPIDEFLTLALSWDRTRAPSLQAFLHTVKTSPQEIKRDLDEAQDLVRVMTVHGAKGLQAPVVFLPDTRHHVRRPTNPLLWDASGDGAPSMLWLVPTNDRDPKSARLLQEVIEHDAQEGRRLLYVAMTRAEDRLYVCGWDRARKPPENCWYNLIERALGDIAVKATDPLLADMGVGDGTILRLTSPQTAPAAPPTPPPPDDEAQPPPAWINSPPAQDMTPAPPLLPSAVPISVPSAASPLASPWRRTRGLFAHRLLQMLPHLPTAARRDAARGALISSEASAQLQQQLIEEVMRVLDNQTFAPLFAPGSLAEVSVVGTVYGRTVSGRIDRLRVTDAEVLIADYKTDAAPPQTTNDIPAAYAAQLALYREVLRGVYPKHPIRCLLVWTAGPTLMELSAKHLDTALQQVLTAA